MLLKCYIEEFLLKLTLFLATLVCAAFGDSRRMIILKSAAGGGFKFKRV